MKAIALLYHDIIQEAAWDSSGFIGHGPNEYKISTEEFESHLSVVQKNLRSGLITANQLPDTTNSPSPPILFTFDDGGLSAYETIAEMLETRDWRGNFFITTDRIDQPGFLSQEQIRELHRRGHLIGSHSCTHPLRMSHCSPDQLRQEWSQSLDRLSNIVGEAITVASVPGGYLSRMVVRTAAEAGVRLLFTSEPLQRITTVDGCLVVGRFSVKRGTAAKVVGEFVRGDLTRRFRQHSYWNMKKAAKFMGGACYLKLRSTLLGLKQRREG